MKRKTILSIAIVVVLAVVCCALFACKRDKNTAGAYYLTGEANNWATYKSDSDVPAQYKLAQDGTNDKVYTLSINLTSGDAFKIAQVNGSKTYGFDAIFSSEQHLVQGSDNKISVATTGAYVLTLNVKDGELQYTCTPEQGGGGDDEAEVLLVAIDDADNFTLTFGGTTTKQLSATVTMDDDSTNHNVTWESSDTGVATVSASGLVTAVSAGIAQITAHAGDKESLPVIVTVEGVVTLSETSLTLNVGDHETLTATVLGGATLGAWSSTDESVVTVDSNGVVTAVGAGTATVRVAYIPRTGAGARFATCEVTVNVPVSDVTLSQNTLNVAIGSTGTLTVNVVPANATNKNYTVEVDEGYEEFFSYVQDGATITITPIAITSAPITLTVKTADGDHEAQCAINVRAAGTVTSAIDHSSLALHKTEPNNTASLTVSVTNDDIASVAWSSSASAVATVSGTAATTTVTGVGLGTTTITATITTVGGETLTETCTVRVAPTAMWIYGLNTWNDTAPEASTNLLMTDNGDGTFSITRHIDKDGELVIGHDDGFTGNYVGIRWNNLSSDVRENVEQGGNDQHGGYNVRINLSGEYTLTVDLNGAAPVLKVKCNSVDVTSINIEITAGSSTLTADSETNSATISLTVNPASATYTLEDITWTCVNDNVTFVVADDKMSATITANDNAEGCDVVVRCEVSGQPATANFKVVAAGIQVTPATSIEFNQSAYSFDLANGWGGTVAAHVNTDATNQNVTYSSSDSEITVNAATGEITATKLGTYTVTATSADNADVHKTVQVTFYSSGLYLTGAANSWPTVGKDGKTKDDVANYIFTATDNTNTLFALDVALSSGSKFQVMFCETTDWGYVIKGSHLDTANSDATASGSDIVAGSAGLYRLTIDLTGKTPTIKAVRTGDTPEYTATLLGAESAELATSGNSAVADNVYVMTIDSVNCEEETSYAIKIMQGATEKDVVAISVVDVDGNVSTAFEVDSGALKCLEAGLYELTITYKPNSKAVVVKAKVLVGSWEVVENRFGVQGIYTYWTTADTERSAMLDAANVTAYGNSASGEYVVQFKAKADDSSSYSFHFQLFDNSVAAVMITPGSTTSCSLGDTEMEIWNDGLNFSIPNKTKDYYFQVTFTISEGEETTYTITDIKVSSSSFAALAE